MKKHVIIAGFVAAVAAGSYALADDVIIRNDTDADTTGSIVIKKPQPRVVVRENPTIVVKERVEPKVIIKDRDPDLVIKQKPKKIIINGDLD